MEEKTLPCHSSLSKIAGIVAVDLVQILHFVMNIFFLTLVLNETLDAFHVEYSLRLKAML